MRAAVLSICCLLAACGGVDAPAAPDAKQTVTLFAATSMTDALNDAAVAFSKQTGHTIKPSYGGSDMLVSQILQGAPADIFVSASADWMKKVEDAGQIDGKSIVIAANRLVCVVPAGAEKPAGPADLKNPRFKVLAIANESVPAGKYARQALEKLGLLADVQARFVGQKDVRTVLRAVADGEAEAGFVYRTEALVETKVTEAFEFDPKLHAPIVYPAAVLKDARAASAARQFLDFLQSKEGREILHKRGFVPVGQP